MAGARGYSGYRGRRSKGKTALMVLLVLVILAAIGVMRMQKYVVYGEDGKPRLELPWQEEPAAETPEEPEEDVNLTIQEPEQAEEVRAMQLTDLPLAAWSATEPEALMASSVDYNAAALTMKDSTGRLYFDAWTPAAASFVKTESGTAEALNAALEDDRYHLIARMSCFCDPKAAMANVETMGLKNTGGYIFYDGNSTQWLDPGKPTARAYLCSLAVELAELGFDEILLTDVTYPTVGKLDKIAYGETMKSENLGIFLTEMKTALEPYDVTLSLELPEAVIAEGNDNHAGLVLERIAPQVDRIYAVTTADQTEALAAAVTAAHGETDFVPELPAGESPVETGGYLRLAE